MIICSSIANVLKRIHLRFNSSVFEEPKDKHTVNSTNFHHVAASEMASTLSILIKTI